MILLLSCLETKTIEEKISENVEVCVAVCEQKNAAGCEIQQSCETSCQNVMSQVGEECAEESLELWTCQQELTWVCSEAGLPVPNSELCSAEEEAYLFCIEPEDTAQ